MEWFDSICFSILYLNKKMLFWNLFISALKLQKLPEDKLKLCQMQMNYQKHIYDLINDK